MYEVTIQHPSLAEKTFTAKDGGELRTLIYRVARAQGHEFASTRDLIVETGGVRSRADIEGVGLIEVAELTVQVKPAENESDYACEGHESVYVGLGEAAYCDGRCVRRTVFDWAAMAYLSCVLDDEDLEESGGCSDCGLEAGDECAACGRCNCDRHDNCTRPKGR
ncbi:hypothetical protein ACFT54_09930 [Streptomyces cinereoruber]|uniref:hypothetical protein n=1 Tax=Streptomyces cinereoruber TaxID=67260 RepID=UPI00362DD299